MRDEFASKGFLVVERLLAVIGVVCFPLASLSDLSDLKLRFAVSSVCRRSPVLFRLAARPVSKKRSPLPAASFFSWAKTKPV